MSLWDTFRGWFSPGEISWPEYAEFEPYEPHWSSPPDSPPAPQSPTLQEGLLEQTDIDTWRMSPGFFGSLWNNLEKAAKGIETVAKPFLQMYTAVRTKDKIDPNSLQLKLPTDILKKFLEERERQDWAQFTRFQRESNGQTPSMAAYPVLGAEGNGSSSMLPLIAIAGVAYFLLKKKKR